MDPFWISIRVDPCGRVFFFNLSQRLGSEDFSIHERCEPVTPDNGDLGTLQSVIPLWYGWV